MRIVPLVVLLFLAPLAGCSGGADDGPLGEIPGADGRDVVRPTPREGSPSSLPGEGAPRVVFLGTSLTEGLGLADPESESWPARLSDLADSAGLPIEVVNAGLSGETSAGSLARLDWILSRDPDVLVIETGANDALRGLPIEQLHANLVEIVRRARTVHPKVRTALVQMEAPTNLGADYTARFGGVFSEVAQAEDVALIPFLLEGVAGLSQLNQADGIHPTAEGHRIMAENAWTTLEPILRDASRPIPDALGN